MKQPRLFSSLPLLLALGAAPLSAQQSSFSNWPAGTSPSEIGTRVAENFIKRTLEVDQGKRMYVIYPEVINWYGSLEVARLTKNADLQQRLIRKFDPLLTTEGAKKISPDAHVDFSVFGGVPLEMFLLTKDAKYLTLGKGFADQRPDDSPCFRLFTKILHFMQRLLARRHSFVGCPHSSCD